MLPHSPTVLAVGRAAPTLGGAVPGLIGTVPATCRPPGGCVRRRPGRSCGSLRNEHVHVEQSRSSTGGTFTTTKVSGRCGGQNGCRARGTECGYCIGTGSLGRCEHTAAGAGAPWLIGAGCRHCRPAVLGGHDEAVCGGGSPQCKHNTMVRRPTAPTADDRHLREDRLRQPWADPDARGAGVLHRCLRSEPVLHAQPACERASTRPNTHPPTLTNTSVLHWVGIPSGGSGRAMASGKLSLRTPS